MEAMLRFLRKLWILTRRDRFESELEEEMVFHLEQKEKELQADGMTSEAARYAAKRQFGNAVRLKEQSYVMVGFRFETAWQDFRYAMRQLRKNPGFALTGILILALGIGATTAIFSAVNPILFEPLPYPQAGRILSISDFGSNGSRLDVTFGTYHELAERSRSFEALAVMRPWQPTMTGRAEPERLDGQRVGASYFRVLGVSPALGQDFQASDDHFRGPNLVILSDGVWRRRLGGDRAIVGRQVTLDDKLFTVIGVMPSGFDNVLAPSAELWALLQYDIGGIADPQSREWGHHLRMVGRLRPGVAPDHARRELNAIAHVPRPEFPRVPWAAESVSAPGGGMAQRDPLRRFQSQPTLLHSQ